VEMSHRRQIKRAVVCAACLSLLALSVGGANAALIKVGNLVLKADGNYMPSALSRSHYEPIDFRGHANLINTDGGTPTALEEMRLDFDRAIKLETRGLPVCPFDRIAHATVSQARRVCAGAIVGTGHVGAIFDLFGAPVEARVPGTLFNGPRQGGNPTLVGHTHTTLPTTRTYAIVIPIEPLKRGSFSYRATFDVPKLAADGVLTHLDGRIGRHYRFKGRERSYLNARCTSGIIRTHGHFLFADDTIMDGTLEKPCTPIPLVPAG
jgi:hypothetical protein